MRINDRTYGDRVELTPLLNAADNNPMLSQALKATEYETAARSLEELKERALTYPDASRQWADLQAELVDALDNGQPYDLMAEAEKLALDMNAFNIAKSVAEDAAKHLRARRDETIRAHIPSAERYLDEQLRQTVDTARTVLDHLDGITDAQAAVDAGKAKHWKQWGELCDTFTMIRNAQASILFRIHRDQGQLDWNRGRGAEAAAIVAIGNADELDSKLGNLLRFGAIHAHNAADSPVIEQLQPLWPSEQFADPAWLVWFAEHPEATPAVPTQAERDERRATLQRIKADATRDGANGATAAHQGVHLGTGYDPRHVRN